MQPSHMGDDIQCIFAGLSAHGLDPEKGSGYPPDPQMRGIKYSLVVHLPLPGQGCLQSQKGLQKWKLQTICDRNYAAMFSQSRSGRKVTTNQSL